MYHITFWNGPRSQNICNSDIKRIGHSEPLSSEDLCPFSHSIIWSCGAENSLYSWVSASLNSVINHVLQWLVCKCGNCWGSRQDIFFELLLFVHLLALLLSGKERVSSFFQFCLLLLFLHSIFDPCQWYLVWNRGTTLSFSGSGFHSPLHLPVCFSYQKRAWQSQHLCQEWTPTAAVDSVLLTWG